MVTQKLKPGLLASYDIGPKNGERSIYRWLTFHLYNLAFDRVIPPKVLSWECFRISFRL